MFGSYSKPITSKGDVNLVVGTYMVPEVFPNLDDIYAPTAKVIHIDLNAYEIGKNHRVDIGVVSDPKSSLEALLKELNAKISPEQKEKAAQRGTEIGNAKKEKHAAEIVADENQKGKSPLQMSQFATVLAEKLPAGSIIFDEALTSSPAITRYIPPTTAGNYFVTRGGSLGVGFPGAIGAKLFSPDKTVIGFSGDGGSMYTIQALWSAVRP